MTIDMLLNMLDKHDFGVHEYKERGVLCGYEMESWTDLGVNMLHFIDCRNYEDGLTVKNTIDQLLQINAAFDVDDEIYELMENLEARQRFSYREVVHDMEAYERKLREMVANVALIYEQTTCELYDVSADNGASWTTQWMAESEAEFERQQGRLVAHKKHQLKETYES